MYEAIQNKEKVSRTFSQFKKKTIQQFENTCNQNIYITQLCKKSQRIRKPVERTEPISKPRRVSTFYGLLCDLQGKQGPHVVAFVAIHSMLESFDYFMLNDYFFNNVFHPDDFAEGIFSEILQDEEILQNSAEWGNLLNIHNLYCEIYDECSNLLNSSLSSAEQEDVLAENEKTKYNENIIYIRNMIEKLLNMNIYATYAWHRSDGATKEELAGGGERAINTADFRMADDVLSSNCLDILFAASGTFTNYILFCNFLQSVFPNLPRCEIDKLVLSLPRVSVFLEQLNYDDEFVKYCVQYLIPISQPNLQLILLKGVMLSTYTNIAFALSELGIDNIVEILSNQFDGHQNDVIIIACRIISYYDIHGIEKNQLYQMIIDLCEDLYYSLLDCHIISKDDG